MLKYIETVNGPIAPEKLGKTMMHEHCLISQPDAYRAVNGEDPDYIAFLNSKIDMLNRSQIYFHMHKHNDNLNLTEEDLIIRELQFYKAAGGDTIVDVTTPGIGRAILTRTPPSKSSVLNPPCKRTKPLARASNSLKIPSK